MTPETLLGITGTALCGIGLYLLREVRLMMASNLAQAERNSAHLDALIAMLREIPVPAGWERETADAAPEPAGQGQIQPATETEES